MYTGLVLDKPQIFSIDNLLTSLTSHPFFSTKIKMKPIKKQMTHNNMNNWWIWKIKRAKRSNKLFCIHNICITTMSSEDPTSRLVVSNVKSVNASLATNRLLGPWWINEVLLWFHDQTVTFPVRNVLNWWQFCFKFKMLFFKRYKNTPNIWSVAYNWLTMITKQ